MLISKFNLFGVFITLITAGSLAHAKDIQSKKLDSGGFQVDIGFISSLARTNEVLPEQVEVPSYKYKDTNLAYGISYFKHIYPSQYLGMGIEVQSIDGSQLVIAKALDYKFMITEKLYFRGNFGAGRYNYRTPSYGYVVAAGGGYTYKGFDFTLRAQFADHLERDKLHSDDPDVNTSSFTNIKSLIFTVGVPF
mgnify:CR=1 FL=1